MRLTSYTDFAIRALMHVALRDGELTRVSDISTGFAISHNHLTKVVHQLGVCGYLSTVQGRNGGLRLARAPEDIRVGEIVRKFEPDLRLVECFEPTSSNCCIESACVLKDAFQDAIHAFLRKLDEVTLADLVRPRHRLKPLLELAALPPSSGG